MYDEKGGSKKNENKINIKEKAEKFMWADKGVRLCLVMYCD